MYRLAGLNHMKACLMELSKKLVTLEGAVVSVLINDSETQAQIFLQLTEAVSN